MSVRAKCEHTNMGKWRQCDDVGDTAAAIFAYFVIFRGILKGFFCLICFFFFFHFFFIHLMLSEHYQQLKRLQ